MILISARVHCVEDLDWHRLGKFWNRFLSNITNMAVNEIAKKRRHLRVASALSASWPGDGANRKRPLRNFLALLLAVNYTFLIVHSYPNKQIRSLFSWPSLLAVAFVCLAGCSSAPDTQWSSPGTKNAGISVTEKSSAFIRDGVTTRAEIYQRLGAPAFDFKLEKTLVYTLEKKKTKQWGFQVFDDSDSFGKGSEQWMFCVRYNDSGQVVRHGTIRAISAESARDTVFRWNRGK